MQLRELEILAPAKNRDIGIAAIDCGADALYIAGPSFGAREAAGNTISDIEALAKYAHKYGAGVYLTLNTILFENEIERAVKIAWEAYESGCDALIIQDLGLLKANLPPLPLFASTQTNIRTLQQAKLLESLGFSRLILARELSLQQIKEISDNCSVDLESFVHGALCVSYSGQCYMSSRITGRSGNRGECAQPCRSDYNLVDSNGKVLIKDKPLLSLKDLNLADYIPQLAKAGITSFKIEGRLKGASYIKNIVRYYRAVADNFLESDTGFRQSSLGNLYGGFTPRPQNTFNRGYTNLYIEGDRGEWNSGDSAKSVGEYIGKVDSTSTDNRGNLVFTYKSQQRIGNGDGLCFISPKGEVTGIRASLSEGKTVYTNDKVSLPPGSALYRNYNHSFERELESNMPKRLIEIKVNFINKVGVTSLEGVREDGAKERVSIEGVYEKAQNTEASLSGIKRQIEKSSGGYTFKLESTDIQELLFYPASVLNEARRALAEKFESVPIEKTAKKQSVAGKNSREIPRILDGHTLDFRANAANALSKKIYSQLGAETVDDAFEISAPKEAELMRCKYCIKFELGTCPSEGSKMRYNEPLFLENRGKRFRLVFDCKNCEMVIFG
ncbi:MAG: collagenase-like protease [Bacteroidetes bacterium HGW-Bacteroidetes-7]|nr:MAG: collagenase-like protease [Bacteroidetes bacterium HGW-Bacteroidetes-7]